MFRSRYPVALAVALALTGLARAQENASPAASAYQDRVGKIITVQEANRAADRCQIGQVWELADGNVAMQTRSMSTGQSVTVVEQVRSAANDRFLVYRWSTDGLPPSGCPMPPGAKSIVITKGYPESPAPSVSPAAAPVVASGSRVIAPPAPMKVTSSGVVQAQAVAPATPVAPAKPQPAPPVAVKSVPPEAPRVVVQAPAQPVKPTPAPVVVPVQPAPPAKVEPPRIIVEDKRSEVKPLPMPVKPMPAPVITEVKPAVAVQQPAPVPSKPVTTELPKVVVQGQAEVIKPVPAPAPIAAPAPAPMMPADAATCAGHLINVTEKGKAPDQCIVLELICQPDGSQMMKVQSLCTGEVMTIVCTDCRKPVKSIFERFHFAKRKGCDVCCEPCPVEPVVAPPKVAVKYDIKKSDKTGDPLLNMEKVASKPKVEKLPDVKKEEPKVVVKPKEEPKLPPVAPKPPAPTKIVDARPIEKPVDKGLMVPVPLVPLATCDDKPGVPPPQPVVRPFETRESKAVTSFEMEPKAPMAPPSAAHMAQMPKTPAVIQAANRATGQPMPSYQTRAPVCDGGVCGPVGTTGWTTGPLRPVTEVPPAIQGVVRASHEQDATSAQNTVYLMTVLQSSGTPAQREWAAKKLCVCDPRTTPYVVDALMTAAKGDSAALVRVACIQSLVKLQAKSAPVIGMLQKAKFDNDPRVADEAVVALTVLADDKGTVQQAGVKAKR